MHQVLKLCYKMLSEIYSFKQQYGNTENSVLHLFPILLLQGKSRLLSYFSFKNKRAMIIMIYVNNDCKKSVSR